MKKPCKTKKAVTRASLALENVETITLVEEKRVKSLLINGAFRSLIRAEEYSRFLHRNAEQLADYRRLAIVNLRKARALYDAACTYAGVHWPGFESRYAAVVAWAIPDEESTQ